MMNRLEAPHGVLSRFFRARGLCGFTQTDALRWMREDGQPMGVVTVRSTKPIHMFIHMYAYLYLVIEHSQ